jgi:hypothetical protein
MASGRGRTGQGHQEIHELTTEQASTVGATVAEIMETDAFERGVDDARKGKPFDWRNGCWEYERGRLFGHIAPLNMPLRIGGKLNPKAVALFSAAFSRKLVI